MEHLQDQSLSLDSPFKHSYLGSFYMPPEKLSHPPLVKEALLPLAKGNVMNLQNVNALVYRTTPDAGSKAVIAALKTLQEKMRRLELERSQAERHVQQFSQAAHEYGSSSGGRDERQRDGQRDGSRRNELVTQLSSAEARCSLLEKQLDYMKKMAESAGKDRTTTTRRQENERQQADSDLQAQIHKLEKLERDCLTLTNTQSVAERKIELLEQKLLEEEHERKLVQEKADELQRELKANLLLCEAAAAEAKPNKKNKDKSSTRKCAAVRSEAASHLHKTKQLPFVAGTSTSPSHSVHATMQSVLHMMKHHHPQLCERVRSLRRRGLGDSEGPTRGGPLPPPTAAGQPL